MSKGAEDIVAGRVDRSTLTLAESTLGHHFAKRGVGRAKGLQP